ncbi:hypothetical protein [Mucilaginibacter aquaedulcis]|uniref:hypothetical protein n=1 Tax=Mucilaginibacter aquaedulcis TaxID=1187081 RepID=UPI0025B5CE70|nr:hypothetical protein [Mucilaginibacter aquaedulcis]MDN3551001.1 hypothetical protein [Mucilaginibacter aquaedulcis]
MDHRGRFQAQGENVEKSENWAQMTVINKTSATALLVALEGQLTRRELEVRDIALQKARTFVMDAPASGYQGQVIKIFNNPGQRKAIRVDVEIRAGWAFANDEVPAT